MNEKQLEFIKSKPYLVRAFEQVTEDDKKYMESLNPNNVSKDEVKKLQNIVKKMTKVMTFKEKTTFGKDIITLLKLQN